MLIAGVGSGAPTTLNIVVICSAVTGIVVAIFFIGVHSKRQGVLNWKSLVVIAFMTASIGAGIAAIVIAATESKDAIMGKGAFILSLTSALSAPLSVLALLIQCFVGTYRLKDNESKNSSSKRTTTEKSTSTTTAAVFL
mmetsp:Transcript_18730/g.30784  ORF Transcript_18730/g.30784 Transcript_18730/m.30784 type:complete len:139 (-) Transcript_18730:896-1312(-)